MREAAKKEKFNNTAISIGNFDGVHLAHKMLIEKAAGEKELLSVVYTFSPHPLKVLGKDVALITGREDKKRLIEGLGADILYTENATKDFLSMEREAFVKDILVGQFGVKKVFVGFDFTFGKGSLGTAEYLKDMGKKLGFEVFIMPRVKASGIIVSSSMARGFIKAGDFQNAAKILGRPHFYSGTVEKCKGLGKKMGFPTANIFPEADLLLPPFGVYAVRVKVDEKRYDGVCNVGVNPTVEHGTRPKMEVNIFDFDEDIYGKRIEIEFYGMIRSEKKFGSEKELKENIEKDVNNAKKCLTSADACGIIL